MFRCKIDGFVKRGTPRLSFEVKIKVKGLVRSFALSGKFSFYPKNSNLEDNTDKTLAAFSTVKEAVRSNITQKNKH